MAPGAAGPLLGYWKRCGTGSSVHCIDRIHGGHVFGDMVDTFEYVKHLA